VRSFEQLDLRLMLAADTCQDEDLPAETASELEALFTDSIYAADAGSTTSTAYDLGQLGATKSLSGSVGGTDRSDFMKFSVATQSTISLGLSGLSSDIDLYLYNSQGTRLAASDKSGASSESISLTLDAGTYYVLVAPWRSAISTYSLSFGASAIVTTPVVSPPTTTPPTTTTPTTDPTTPSTAFPDVAYYGSSNDWNLNAINGPESWAQGYTGQGVVVAVIDTGVDVNHPDLMSQLWVNAGEIAGNGIDDDGNGYVDDIHGWDFSSNDNNPDDGNGHGTHVAGTIAADNNGTGATGVAYDATIMPVRVLGNNGSGTAASVAAGIRYAADMGADIINLSLGGSYSALILSAIQYAVSHNVLVVAAAGNESASTPGYPARFSSTLAGVLSVGAYSSSGAIASFSNDVGNSGAVQVDAPGVGIYSTYAGDQYSRLSGTSMATPHVAGLAALALSANPNLTAAQLRSLIVAGTNQTISGSDSNGGINAALTVAMAVSSRTTTSSSSVTTSSVQTTTQTISSRSFHVSSETALEIVQSVPASARFEQATFNDLGPRWIFSPMSMASASAQAAHDVALLDWADDWLDSDDNDDSTEDPSELAECLAVGGSLIGLLT
jgi:subtilisin family serine protease